MPGGVALWSAEAFETLDEILNSQWQDARKALIEGDFFERLFGPALSENMARHVEVHWLGPQRSLGTAPDPSLKSAFAWFSQPLSLRKEVLKKTLLTALDMAGAGAGERKPIQTLLACFRSELASSTAQKPVYSERFDATVQSGPNQVTVVLFCSPIPGEGGLPRASGEAAVIGEEQAMESMHWLDWGKKDPAEKGSTVVVTRFATPSDTAAVNPSGQGW